MTMNPLAAMLRRSVHALALAILIAASTHGTAVAAPTGRIRVLPQATVAGATVRLSDLAALEGTGVDFAEIEIGPAPEAGTTRRISGQSVLARLQESGLSDAVAYTIPATVGITRAHQTVDERSMTKPTHDMNDSPEYG